MVESVYGLFEEVDHQPEDMIAVFNLFSYEYSALQNYKQFWSKRHQRYLKDLPLYFKKTAAIQMKQSIAKALVIL